MALLWDCARDARFARGLWIHRYSLQLCLTQLLVNGGDAMRERRASVVVGEVEANVSPLILCVFLLYVAWLFGQTRSSPPPCVFLSLLKVGDYHDAERDGGKRGEDQKGQPVIICCLHNCTVDQRPNDSSKGRNDAIDSAELRNLVPWNHALERGEANAEIPREPDRISQCPNYERGDKVPLSVHKQWRN